MFTANEIAFLVMCGALLSIGAYMCYWAIKEDNEKARQGTA